MPKTPHINDAGTLVELDEDDGDLLKRFRAAGYRPLKDGEPVPIQMTEEPDFLATLAAPPVPDLSPSKTRLQAIRRELAANDGAEG